MPKLVLIDHSLRNIGSHHFEYALQILKAADKAGLQPVLATHQSFGQQRLLPGHWEVHNLYQFDTYSKYTLFAGLDRLNSEGQSTFKLTWPWHRRRVARMRAARSEQFAADTARLFAQVQLTPGDHVFVPTLSEIDTLGLMQYLRGEPQTQVADWHLQYHYPLYAGREPDYPLQDDRVADLRHAFRHALRYAPQHRLHFYTTTAQLTTQYNRLGVAHFRELPYPVNLSFRLASRSAASAAPLKATYVGDARPEKGYQHLPAVVQEVWSEMVESGQLEFVLQSNFPFELPARGKNAAVAAAREALEAWPADKLDLIRAPMQSEDYTRLVLNGDIGLLLYDESRYYARCSGIFTEMLSAGIPVIATPGGWMADQLADVTHDYHLQLSKKLPTIQRLDGRTLDWRPVHAAQRATDEISIGSDSDRIATRVDTPAKATHLLVSFRWSRTQREATRGAYLQIDAESADSVGRVLGSWRSVVGQPESDRLATILIPFPAGANELRLMCRNAYGRQALSLTNMELAFLSAAGQPGGTIPLGAVSLIAARPEQAAALLRDMVRHYDHYRDTAAAFAGDWAAWHNPQRIVAELLSARAGRADRNVYRPKLAS